jgi:DNA-binding NtrC family response regulator
VAQQGIRVLIVDDEPTLADTLALIVTRSGYESMAVYNGEEAIEAAILFKPHAVISDVMMPGMNGIELARYFADNFTGCRVLLMTGHDSADNLVQASLSCGYVVNILTKPVMPQTILAFVASCAETLANQKKSDNSRTDTI